MSQSSAKRRRVAQMRARQATAEARRRRLLFVGGPVAAVLTIVLIMVVIRVAAGAGGRESAEVDTSAAAATITKVTSLTGLDKAGAPPRPLLTPVSGQPELTRDGKPRVLYVGAEFCPFCASQRWPLVIALSRFGSFSGLELTHSSADDVHPNTPTLTFVKSSYTSEYLAFTPVETADREGEPLQRLAPEDQALVDKLNAPPYVDARSKGSIPFLDFGNKYMISGSSVSTELFAGLKHAEVADRLADPSTDLGRRTGAAANAMTAALCDLTGGEPAQVCGGPVVKELRNAG